MLLLFTDFILHADNTPKQGLDCTLIDFSVVLDVTACIQSFTNSSPFL